jgi:hypothetical protein
VDRLTRNGERLQAQLGILANVLQDNVQLQEDLAESRQLCIQRQSQLADSSIAQQLAQQARDDFERQIITHREASSQAQQQASFWTLQFEKVYSALCGAQALLDPQATRFDHTSSNFSDTVRHFFSRISARLPAPWATVQSALVSRDVQIDELTSANISYARELRELRAQVLELSSRRT